MKKLILPFLLIISLSFISCKQDTADKKSENRSETTLVDSAAISRLDSTLQTVVNSGNIAGISALIYENGQEVYYNAFGYADIAAKKPMDRNTIVQIYSMTKPITGTALMTLYEEGKFDLEDPISKYIPEFDTMTVYAGVDAKGRVLTEPLEREITIRDVTRHTAGFPNRPDIPGLSDLLQNADAMNRENSLTQMAEKMATVPLWFQPGTQWEYGPSVDVQALLVERIAGVPYGDYVREHVLAPLGMKDTRYFIPEGDRDRFARLYIRTGEGELVQDSLSYSNYTEHWPLTRGGSGLTSTLDDYMRFAQMLVHGGESGYGTDPKTVNRKTHGNQSTGG